MMSGKRVKAESNRQYELFAVRDSGVRKARTDIGAIAAKDKKSATVMIWNYHDEDLRGDEESVDLFVKNVNAKQVTVHEYRIDSAHSNSYEVWKKMGSPQQPTPEQITQLEKAGQLEKTSTKKMSPEKNVLTINTGVPRQGIVFYKIEW
jgi:xylan 1,4-beta-xylosidase